MAHSDDILELATAHIEGIAVKVIILNNQHLGMVVQVGGPLSWRKSRAYFLGDPKDLKRIYPDYVDMCKGFGVPCERIQHKKDVEERSSECSIPRDLRSRHHDALHRARVADDSLRDDLQGHYYRVTPAFDGDSSVNSPALIEVVARNDCSM